MNVCASRPAEESHYGPWQSAAELVQAQQCSLSFQSPASSNCPVMEDETAVLDDIFNEDAFESEHEAAGEASDPAAAEEAPRPGRRARQAKARTRDLEESDASSTEASDAETSGAEEEEGSAGASPLSSSRRRGRSSRKQQPHSSSEPTDDKIMEARRDFEEALSKIKATSGSRRRREPGNSEDGSESVNYDELAIDFTNRMMAAVKKDDEAVAADKPALAKLRMLNEVSDMLTKKHMQEVLLDNQALGCIKRWLEPNIRGQLAVHTVRKRLLELLQMLPVETVHLRESGLGRIIMFYYQRKTEAADIRKLAGDLISTWSRPIIGSSLDYREMLQTASSRQDRAESEPAAASAAKVIQSEKFRAMSRTGLLDRDSPQDQRYRRLTSALHRQKHKKTGGF